MHYIFFILSSVDECLSCFHILAILNIAVMITGVYIAFQIRVFSRYMPTSASLVAQMVESLPAVWETRV